MTLFVVIQINIFLKQKQKWQINVVLNMMISFRVGKGEGVGKFLLGVNKLLDQIVLHFQIHHKGTF